MSDPLIQVIDLSKYYENKFDFFGKKSVVKAVDGVNLTIGSGEILGVVGESGCGKTTLGRTILRLTEPTLGDVLYKGKSLVRLSAEEMRAIRQKLQIIFQDTYSTLNPRMTVRETIRLPLDVHRLFTAKEREEKVLEIMERVSLSAQMLNRYPHEFSGGQRQRISIACALISNPEFIICDEPVSALDVSVQSQILNLMQDLQKELKLTYMFISHDLSVVRYICDRVAVMYLGKIVEVGSKASIFDNPLHPYTQALMSAIPVPDVDHVREKMILPGDVPSPIDPPSGCSFHPRCRHATERCGRECPPLMAKGEAQQVACHL